MWFRPDNLSSLVLGANRKGASIQGFADTARQVGLPNVEFSVERPYQPQYSNIKESCRQGYSQTAAHTYHSLIPRRSEGRGERTPGAHCLCACA